MKKMAYPMAILLNCALLLLCLTYPISNLDVFPWLMAVSHIALFLLNLKAGRSWPGIILLCCLHVAATYFTHQFYTLLYFSRILGSMEGRKWAMGLCLIDTAWTIVLFLISMVVFGIRVMRAAKRNA